MRMMKRVLGTIGAAAIMMLGASGVASAHHYNFEPVDVNVNGGIRGGTNVQVCGGFKYAGGIHNYQCRYFYLRDATGNFRFYMNNSYHVSVKATEGDGEGILASAYAPWSNAGCSDYGRGYASCSFGPGQF